MKNNSTTARCENCYFRRAELGAERVRVACPTFRPHTKGALARLRPLQLAPRPPGEPGRAPLKVAAA